jgi:hypothetical protein
MSHLNPKSLETSAGVCVVFYRQRGHRDGAVPRLETVTQEEPTPDVAPRDETHHKRNPAKHCLFVSADTVTARFRGSKLLLKRNRRPMLRRATKRTTNETPRSTVCSFATIPFQIISLVLHDDSPHFKLPTGALHPY